MAFKWWNKWTQKASRRKRLGWCGIYVGAPLPPFRPIRICFVRLSYWSGVAHNIHFQWCKVHQIALKLKYSRSQSTNERDLDRMGWHACMQGGNYCQKSPKVPCSSVVNDQRQTMRLTRESRQDYDLHIRFPRAFPSREAGLDQIRLQSRFIGQGRRFAITWRLCLGHLKYIPPRHHRHPWTRPHIGQ